MTPDQYKSRLDEIKIKRGIPPDNWWCSHDEKINKDMPRAMKAKKEEPGNYNRELAYQKALHNLNRCKLRGAKVYKKGEILKIKNIYPYNNLFNVHIQTRNPCEIIKVIVSDRPKVSSDGNISYPVSFKYRKNECMSDIAGYGLREIDEHFFDIDISEIIK